MYGMYAEDRLTREEEEPTAASRLLRVHTHEGFPWGHMKRGVNRRPPGRGAIHIQPIGVMLGCSVVASERAWLRT